MNEDSILKSIKHLLLIPDADTQFDNDIIVHVNTVLSNLVQMGVGPKDGFVITGNSETWSDFIGDDPKLQPAKTYVYIKVRMIFDPPSSSAVMDAYNRQASELEYRLYSSTGGY